MLLVATKCDHVDNVFVGTLSIDACTVTSVAVLDDELGVLVHVTRAKILDAGESSDIAVLVGIFVLEHRLEPLFNFDDIVLFLTVDQGERFFAHYEMYQEVKGRERAYLCWSQC